KHNRDKIKTGDVYELAEVVRNLAIREAEKGLSTGEKQMFTRARKILASELMYALEMTAEQVELHLDSLLLDSSGPARGSLSSNGKVTASDDELRATGEPGAAAVATNGKIAAATGGLPSLDGDLALAPE
ncbi:MAG TPA: hypothetical protein VGL78_16775, partial [Solirubrobacteraceae bacterium]